MRINDYSFKHVCVVKVNSNKANSITPNQPSELVILKSGMLLEFQNKANRKFIEF